MNTSANIISLTTIPRRFETTLPSVVDALRIQAPRTTILVNIPAEYKKWGKSAPPLFLNNIENVVVFMPSEDYGPATKLLGALEYTQAHQQYERIITFDDDVVPRVSSHLRHLMRCATIFPECAVTINGIELVAPPYRAGAGLSYRSRLRAVHAPAGYKAVAYPVRQMATSNTPFALRNELPKGVFHDDDAYFGIVLAKMGIPLIAVPGRGVNSLTNDGGSAVVEQTGMDRRDNEMEIFRHALDMGYWTVPAPSFPTTLSQRAKVWTSYVGSIFGQ